MPVPSVQPQFVSNTALKELKKIPKATLLPTFSNTRVKPLSSNRLKSLNDIDLKNFSNANNKIASLDFKRSEINSAMKTVSKTKTAKESVNFSKSLIVNWKTGEQALSHSKEMMNWARTGKKKEREIISKAFIETNQSDLLVHNIGGMEKDDARAFMKDFLASGGKSEDVYEWLAGAGGFLRKNNLTEPKTDGFLGDIWGAVTDAADWVWGAITTVADAVEAAAENLGRAIGEIASWSISKISDVVRSLVAAGKSVADILSAALSKSVAAMKKFVRAIIQAGRSTLSVLEWAARKASSIVRSAVRALISAGKSIVRIVKSAIRGASSVVRSIVQALINIGHDVEDMIEAVINATSTQVKNLIDAFLRAGQGILEIIRETLTEAAASIRKVVKALFDLGKSLGQILAITIQSLGSHFLRETLKAILSAGKSLSNILRTALQSVSGLMTRLVTALAKIGQSVSGIIHSLRTAASSVLRQVMRGLSAASKHISEVLNAVKNYVGSRLNRMISAIYQAFRQATDILKTFMRRGVSIIRTVLEGLFAAGYNFVTSIKTILVNVAKEFQKDFFAGLVALGHSVTKIMGEALKLAGALAALAFTAILELFGGHRPLTAEERKAARDIFGWSIDLDRIKIAHASLPADLILKVNGGRPFTTMHILNFPSGQTVNIKTLIHELTHTWQGVEVGPVYMIEALHDQFTMGKDAYKVTRQMLQENNGNFSKFGREQQASLIDTYYHYKIGSGKDDIDAIDWLTDLRPYARQVYRRQDGMVWLDPRLITPVLSPTFTTFNPRIFNP